VEIRWAILDQPPAAIAEMVNSEFDTRNPFTFNFEEDQRGKRFYFVLRWENGIGGKGDWNPITNATIP
jgi:hypothetical protein